MSSDDESIGSVHEDSDSNLSAIGDVHSNDEEDSGEERSDNLPLLSRDEDRSEKKKCAFDTTLPSQHLYLGDLERGEGQLGSVHQEHEVVQLPLLPMTARTTVIFPGETLPLNVFDIQTKMLIRDAKTRGMMIVLAYDTRDPDAQEVYMRPKREELFHIGVISEIAGMRDGAGEREGEGIVPYSSLMIKLIGRHRCEILECVPKINGVLEGRVRVLPELLLPPIPPDHLACTPAVQRSAAATVGLLSSGHGTSLTEPQAEDKLRHVQCLRTAGSLTSVPPWIYHRYQLSSFRAEILKELQMMTIRSPNEAKGYRLQRIPDDATGLSYWLVKRLPVRVTVKLELLSIDCPTLRIIRALEILKGFTELHCASCDTRITKKTHIFSMSVDGPLASYVNPGGYVHDTLTVSRAKNIFLQGRPTSEHSWFPGYAWTILTCHTCHCHLGWRFDACKKTLKPNQFFGLTRAALELVSPKKSQ